MPPQMPSANGAGDLSRMIEELQAPCTHPHHEPQHEPHQNRESPTSRITDDFRRGKLMFLPASSEFAPARREHVFYPLALAAVSEGNDEAIGRSKDVYRSAVNLPRLATHVCENAETRKPTSEQTGDPVREDNVDLRQPSLAKPHHENA